MFTLKESDHRKDVRTNLESSTLKNVVETEWSAFDKSPPEIGLENQSCYHKNHFKEVIASLTPVGIKKVVEAEWAAFGKKPPQIGL